MGRIIYRKGDLEAIRATFKVEQHFSREDEERFQLLEDKQVNPVKRESGGGINNNSGGTRGGESGFLSTSTHNNHSSNNSGAGGGGFHSNHLSSNIGGGGSFGNHNSGHHHNNNNNMNNTHNSRGGDGTHNRGERRDHRRQLNDRFSLPQRPPRVGNRDEEAFEAGYRYELEMNEAQRRELQATMEKEEKKHQQDRQQTDTAPSSLATEELRWKETEELEQFFASLTAQQAIPAGGVAPPAKKSRFFHSGASASETKVSETDGVKADLIWGPSSSAVVDGDAATGGGGPGGMRDSRASGVNAHTNMSSSHSGVGRRADPNASPSNVFAVGDEKDSHLVAEVHGGSMNLLSSFHHHVSAGMPNSASQDNRDAANKSFSSASANQLAQLLLSSTSAAQRSQGSPHSSSSTEGVRGGSHYLPVATSELSNGSVGGHDTDGNRSALHSGQVWNVQDLERVLLQPRSGTGTSNQRGGEGGEAASGLLEGKAISASELESRLFQQARQKNSRNSGSHSGSPASIALNSSTESGVGIGSGMPRGNLSPLTSAQTSNIPSPTIPPPGTGATTKPQGVQVVSGSSSASFPFPGLSVNQTIQVAQQQQQQQSSGAPRYLQHAQAMQHWSTLQYPQGVNLSKILVAPGGVAGQNGSKLPPGSATSWNSSSPFVTYGYAASTGVNRVVYSNPQQQLMYQSRNISPFSTNANPNQYALFAQQQQQQATRPPQQPGKQ